MPARRGRTSVGQSQPLAAVDPGRNLGVDAPERLHAPLPAAVPARREDAAAGGVACGARRRRDHLAEDRAAHLSYLARPSAHVAAGQVRAGLAPGSVAALAGDGQPDLHRMDDAERGFPEGELDGDLGVEASGRSRRSPLPTEGVAVQEGFEQVPEPEGVARLPGAGPGTRRAVRSEDVVPAPPLGVAQRLVRDRDLFELGLGVGVVGCESGGTGAARYALDVGFRSHAATRRGPRSSYGARSIHACRRPSCCETTATAPIVRR